MNPSMTIKGRKKYNGWGQVQVATLDATDLFDLFGFLKMRLMEKGNWCYVEKIMLNKDRLEREKEFYQKHFKQSE